MDMWFVTGTEVTILFKSWKTTTATEYAFSCIAVIVMGIVFEGLKVWRKKLDVWIRTQLNGGDEAQPLLTNSAATPKKYSPSKLWMYQALRTLIHGLNFTLAYFLMLIAMTYNVGLFVSMIAGVMIGYFFFLNGDIQPGCGCQSDSSETTADCH